MGRTAKVYAAEKQIQHLQYAKSRSLDPAEHTEQDKQLQEAQREKRSLLQGLHLNVQLLFWGLLFVTLGLAVTRAFLQGSLLWLFKVPAEMPQTAGDYATVLTPLIAIAVAIERLLETGFNWFEQSSRAVADVLVAPKDTLDWIGREYQDAYKATEEAAAMVGTDMTPETLQLLNMTENRLAQAEERLRSWVTAPEYLAWKRALAIWFGLLAGLVIAVLGDLGMLRYIGIPAPRLIDMIITGLVIGSGPGPMHDLIGILQSGKDALGSLSDLAKGKSVQQAVEALRREGTLPRTEVV
jgi:hypothetical protein